MEEMNFRISCIETGRVEVCGLIVFYFYSFLNLRFVKVDVEIFMKFYYIKSFRNSRRLCEKKGIFFYFNFGRE